MVKFQNFNFHIRCIQGFIFFFFWKAKFIRGSPIENKLVIYGYILNYRHIICIRFTPSLRILVIFHCKSIFIIFLPLTYNADIV